MRAQGAAVAGSGRWSRRGAQSHERLRQGGLRQLTDVRADQPPIGRDEQRGRQPRRVVGAQQRAVAIQQHQRRIEPVRVKVRTHRGGILALIDQRDAHAVFAACGAHEQRQLAHAGRAPGSPQVQHQRRAAQRRQWLRRAIQRAQGDRGQRCAQWLRDADHGADQPGDHQSAGRAQRQRAAQGGAPPQP